VINFIQKISIGDKFHSKNFYRLYKKIDGQTRDI
jgi:hypothetical protein